MSQNPRLIFIHDNQTTHWSFAWPGWLKPELDKLGFETFFETMPDSIIARSQYWLPFLKEHIKAGENDVLIGWSSGAVAAMRYAENNQIRGSILISPCYNDLDDELEKQSGYYDAPWQWEAIKHNQQKMVLLHGDDDLYIPQDEFHFIAKRLDASRIEIHEGRHFVERTAFLELLEYIKQTYPLA